ncbi:hypothetical protein [Streptomyces sp. TR02-1]|uniref:hypothetical protein n=1 Tax=Streptomyces sp. TR02-1 TaxID=3385977 RepID=UPI0039A3F38F
MSALTATVLSEEVNLWDRQPGETARQYNQFRVYLDLGRTRSLTKAAETLTISYGQVRNIASARRWTTRAEAWDAHKSAEFEAQWTEERLRAAEDDARVLKVVMGKVASKLQGVDAAKMSLAELARFTDLALKYRRLLYGDPAQALSTDETPAGDAGAERSVRHKFEQLPADVRRAQILDLSDKLRHRTAAVSGTDDDE